MSARPAHHEEIDLPAGTIRYREAGEGRPVVFVHGYLVDGRLWDGVVDALSDRCRCLAPDWPIGAQQVAMNPDADLSPTASRRRSPSFLEALDLEDVTIVGNDSGGAMSQVLRHPPPGADRPPRADQLRHLRELPAGDLQGDAAARRAARRHGGARRRRSGSAPSPAPPSGRSPSDAIPPELIASWMEPGTARPGRARDLKKVTVGMNKRYTLEAAERCAAPACRCCSPGRPATASSRLKYAERLAGESGNARIVEIPDASTFVAARPAGATRRGDRRRSPAGRANRRTKRPCCELFFATCRFFV